MNNLKKYSKCNQKKCGYLKFGGCRKCDECDSKSFILDDDCTSCWNCSMDEGIIRWNDEDEIIIEDKQKTPAPEIC